MEDGGEAENTGSFCSCRAYCAIAALGSVHAQQLPEPSAVGGGVSVLQ